jgi:tetratricopeptide (TPR) repeat protein
MFEILSILTLICSSYLLVRILRAEGPIEFIFIFFCVVTAQIVLIGHLLSYVNHLSDESGWALLSIMALFTVAGIVMAAGGKLSAMLPGFNVRTLSDRARSVKTWYLKEITGFEKLLLTPMILVVLALGALNLAIVVFVAPANYDGMSHHLARMAYYLQHDSLDYFPANFWAQVAKVKNAILLILYSYLMSGKNENLTRLLQFISYWVAVCSVYGIARKTGNSRTHSLFASLVSALLVVWLMESVTTQNDMLLAAYFGVTLNFLLAFRKAWHRKYLALAALAAGLAIGASAKSLLALPSLSIVACYVLLQADTYRERIRNFAYFAAFLCIAIFIFAIPSGYVENYQKFDNPLGPNLGTEQIKDITFTGKSADYVSRNGAKNLLRFGFEFLTLDGLPPVDVVLKAQSMVRAVPMAFVNFLGLDLESSEAVIKPFRYQKPFIFFAHEDWSSWGMLGFALIWIVVFLSLIGVIRSKDIKVLSFAALVFPFIVAFALPYEPHYTRYFTTCAVFAVPTVAVVLRTGKTAVRAYVLFVVLLGCVTAVSAVVLRPARPVIAMKHLEKKFPQIRRFEFLNESVFNMGRVRQLSSNAMALYPAIKAFDILVPEDATVAVYLYGDTYEYPLFGEYLTRTIIPVNPFAGSFKEIPEDADYLLYVKGFPLAASNDLYLGADWYLRRLPGANDDAIKFYEAALKLRPDHAFYHNRLGIAYAKKGSLDKAIVEFETAVRIAPDKPSFRYNLDRAKKLRKPGGAP